MITIQGWQKPKTQNHPKTQNLLVIAFLGASRLFLGASRPFCAKSVQMGREAPQKGAKRLKMQYKGREAPKNAIKGARSA